MRLNKEKHIGRVLFIVEGSHTEFSILRRIFCNLLGYSYIEKRRNKPTYFTSTQAVLFFFQRFHTRQLLTAGHFSESITGSLVQRNFCTVLFVKFLGFFALAVFGVNVLIGKELTCQSYLLIDIVQSAFGGFQLVSCGRCFCLCIV